MECPCDFILTTSSQPNVFEVKCQCHKGKHPRHIYAYYAIFSNNPGWNIRWFSIPMSDEMRAKIIEKLPSPI